MVLWLGCAKEDNYEDPNTTLITLNTTVLGLEVNDTYTLVATVTGNGNLGSVVWKSSDPQIAMVDDKGKVTALKGGVVSLTASVGKASGTCTVVIEPNNNKVKDLHRYQ